MFCLHYDMHTCIYVYANYILMIPIMMLSYIPGLFQDQVHVCSSSVSRGLAITGNTDLQVQVSMPDPVCIRCGYLDGITAVLVTDTDDVTYNTGGNVIVNTTDISVTNDGLILNAPGNTFSDGTSIMCTFNQPGMGSVSRTITIEHLCKKERKFL